MQPEPARAVRASGSTSTWFIGPQSMTTPSSQEEKPGVECPPPRTATWTSCSRAKASATFTSLAEVQRAMTAGRLSIIPLNSARASS
jgi:hypothetical protein